MSLMSNLRGFIRGVWSLDRAPTLVNAPKTQSSGCPRSSSPFSENEQNAIRDSFANFADTHGYKRAKIAFPENEQEISITFDKTILYKSAKLTGRSWWHSLANFFNKMRNVITSGDKHFDPEHHAGVICEALGNKLYDKFGSLLPKVSVQRSSVKLFGIPLWERGGTLTRQKQDAQPNATQPGVITLTWTRDRFLTMDEQQRLGSVVLAGICTPFKKDDGETIYASKRNTWNPIRRFILAFFPDTGWGPLGWLHQWARSKEWGKGFNNIELDVPAINSGVISSTANIVVGLGSVGGIAVAAGPGAGITLPVAGVAGVVAYGATATAGVGVAVYAWTGFVTSYFRKIKEGQKSLFFSTNTALDKVNPEEDVHKLVPDANINTDSTFGTFP